MAPLLPYFLAYLGGVLASLPATAGFFLPHALTVCALTAACFFFHRSRNNGWAKKIAFVCLVPAGLLAPDWADFFRPASHIEYHLDETRRAAVEGRVIAIPQKNAERVRLQVELEQIRYGVNWTPVTGRAQITLYDTAPPAFRAGEKLRVHKLRLKRPRNFKNPGRFDYERYMRANDIDVTGNLSKASAIEKLGAAPLPFAAAFRIHLRERFLASLSELFQGEEAALLKALLLSDKSSLSETTRESYLATGLAHLMAVSGLHVGFVAAAEFVLFWPLLFRACLRYRPEWAQSGTARKAAAFLCLGPVLFYLILVGQKVSALRAGIMVCVVLIAFCIDRQRNLFNALLLAAFALLILDAKAVLDPGFQLSFAATAAVLCVFHVLTRLMQDPVNRMGEPAWWQRILRQPDDLPFWRRLLFQIQKTTACGAVVSFAVLFATLPILIVHFNRVSLIGWLLNLLMIPLASLLVPLALATVLIGMAAPGLAHLLAFPVTALLKGFLFVPEVFARLPFASLHVPTPPDFWFLLYAAALTAVVLLWVFDNTAAPPRRLTILRLSLPLAAPVLILWLVAPRLHLLPTDTLRISILDVGQGESIFVEFPNRETMILDGGGFYKNALDVGRRVVAPFLWSRGIGRIDYLAPSHSDNDHISGLESLVTLFPVGHFLDGFTRIPDARIDALRAAALANGARRIPLTPGVPFSVGDVTLLPLHPDPQPVRLAAFSENPRAGNDRSLVLRLEYKQFSMLLTGDIGSRVERRLIENAAPIQATLLKSPHHGSRFSNSADFIQAVNPKAVVFSSGYLSWMKHPHPEVLKRYEKAGSVIFRTDLNGSIHIETDGHHHRIRAQKPDSHELELSSAAES